MSTHNLTPDEQSRWLAYATACENDRALAEAVREATQAEGEAWEQEAVKVPFGVPDDELPNDERVAYVALQRAELREYALHEQRRQK